MAARPEQLIHPIRRLASAPALLSAVVVLAGTGTLAFSTRSAESEQPSGPTTQQAQQPQPRRDRHGDPLPPHAIARLGTLRFRGVRGCLAFSPDGKLLASAAGKAEEHIALWDTATGRKIRQITGTDRLMQLAFSPDGRRLAISDDANRCRVVDTNTGKVRFTLPGMHGTFSADGKILVTGETSGLAGQVLAWDAATGKGILKGFPARVQELVVIGDGRTVAVTDQKEPSVVKVVDLTKGKLIRSFRLAWVGEPRLSLSADGKTLASADINRVRLWDLAKGKRIAVWNCRNLSGAAVFSPDGKRLAWTSQDEKGGNLRLWVVERAGGKPRAVGAPVHNFETPCFSPDGKRLAVLTDACVLSLRNVADGKEVPFFDTPNRPVIDLTFGADGRQVIIRGGDEVFAWEARSGKLLRRGTLLP
ncbi:MAG: WD40 repeat domain-containing protein, partial [Gemmataceae bacterium]